MEVLPWGVDVQSDFQTTAKAAVLTAVISSFYRHVTHKLLSKDTGIEGRDAVLVIWFYKTYLMMKK